MKLPTGLPLRHNQHWCVVVQGGHPAVPAFYFAPSIIKEAANDFFHLSQDSPYMNIVAKVRDSKKHLIPAVVHIDNTARVHTVTEESNKIYYKLIKSFGNRTGVPVLLNTSFNIQEPIVYSPEDAIKTYLKSNVLF